MADPTRELTESEILDRFGGLIWEALQAFAEDPLYLTDMCMDANLIEAGRPVERRDLPEHPDPPQRRRKRRPGAEERIREVHRLTNQGLSTEQVATALSISRRSVQRHLKDVATTPYQ